MKTNIDLNIIFPDDKGFDGFDIDNTDYNNIIIKPRYVNTYIPKEGDIVKIINIYDVAVFGVVKNSFINSNDKRVITLYASIIPDTHRMPTYKHVSRATDVIAKNNLVFKATPEEVEFFHNYLKQHNFIWNKSIKNIEHYNWMPNVGDSYWTIDYNEGQFVPVSKVWKGSNFDMNMYHKKLIKHDQRDIEKLIYGLLYAIDASSKELR